MDHLKENSEYFNTVSGIVSGIARRCQNKFKGLDFDDLEQELWMKVLDLQQSRGKDSKLDLGLVAKSCYDRVVDLQRYGMIRNHYNLGDNADFIEDYQGSTAYWDGVDLSIIIQQLYFSFPSGSKEAKFLEYWMESSGIKDFGIRPKGSYLDGYSETNLSLYLGFTGTSDSNYKRFRQHMRETVREFIYE